MAWALCFDLWAPIVGALALGAGVEAGPRRDAALASYVRAAMLVHFLAFVTALVVRDVALPLLAGLDVALLVAVASILADEKQLARVLALIAHPDSVEVGSREAERWLDSLRMRAAATPTFADHALACAEALDAAGRPERAEAVLDRVRAPGLAPSEIVRVAVARGLLALQRGDVASARTELARALAQPARPREALANARAAWALLDALEGRYAHALEGASRVAEAGAIGRAMLALARAHAHVGRGEDRAAAAALESLDDEAFALAFRVAAACPGPASARLNTAHPEGVYR